MRSIRALIYGLPILLLILAVASFICVKSFPAKIGNELINGTIGDATMIDPVLSSDQGAADLEAFVFNGLVKYDQNLNLVGDLAKSWEQRQTTTFFFANHDLAQAALQQINAQQAQWSAWGLAKAEVANDELRLDLKKPGKEIPNKIATALAATTSLPLTVIDVQLKNSAKKIAAKLQQKSSSLASAIKRVWINGDDTLELTCVNNGVDAEQALKRFFAQQPKLDAKMTVSGKFAELNEPEIIFHLRKNVRWHDGVPFTSRDVAFTYHAIMDPEMVSPQESSFEKVARLVTPDPYTVDVFYRQVYSPALLSWSMGIVPAHILQGKTREWWAKHFNRSPVGTGPFKFSEWRTGDFVKLVRNDDYFEGKPSLDAIIVRCIPDPVSLRVAFETKQLDFLPNVDPWAIGSYKKNPHYQLFTSTTPSYNYICWNLRRPLFQDKRVRVALAHAVNVQAIIRYLLYGYGSQSVGIFPPQMPYANHDIQPISYDPAKAKQLLAEAGWKPGPDGILMKNGKRFSFTILTNNGNELRKDIATLVQADLRKIGIQVSVQSYEWTVFLDRVMKHDFDADVLAWNLSFNYDQYQIWSSTQTHPGQLNAGGYSNPEVDRLLEKIRTEYDMTEIKRDCSKMQKIIYDDQPYLFLCVPKSVYAMWKGSYRIYRPLKNGKWVDEPVHSTKAGFSVFEQWFYRPQHPPKMETKNR